MAEFQKRLNWTRPPERIKGGVFSSRVVGDSLECKLGSGRRFVRHSISTKELTGDVRALTKAVALRLCVMWDDRYGMPLLENPVHT